MPDINYESVLCGCGAGLEIGNPVCYITDPLTGQLQVKRGVATDQEHSEVWGVSMEIKRQGEMVNVGITGHHLSLDDWTAIIGTQRLVPGRLYYLSASPGMVSITPPKPEEVGSDCYIVPVYIATSTTRACVIIDGRRSINRVG